MAVFAIAPNCSRAMPTSLLVDRMELLAHRLIELLRQGVQCGLAKTAGTCAEILAVAHHAFTSVLFDGVEPTNNSAERTLLARMMWRKQSFGTQSPHSSRFVERMLTCHATLSLRQRAICNFLFCALKATLTKSVPPSLLPAWV